MSIERGGVATATKTSSPMISTPQPHAEAKSPMLNREAFSSARKSPLISIEPGRKEVTSKMHIFSKNSDAPRTSLKPTFQKHSDTAQKENSDSLFDSIHAYLRQQTPEKDTTIDSVVAFLADVRKASTLVVPQKKATVAAQKNPASSVFSKSAVIKQSQVRETPVAIISSKPQSLKRENVSSSSSSDLYEVPKPVSKNLQPRPQEKPMQSEQTQKERVEERNNTVTYSLQAVELAEDIKVAQRVLVKRVAIGMPIAVAKAKTIAEVKQVILKKTKTATQVGKTTPSEAEPAENKKPTQVPYEVTRKIPDMIFEVDKTANDKRKEKANRAIEELQDPQGKEKIQGRDIAKRMPRQKQEPEVKSEIVLLPYPYEQKDYSYEEVVFDMKHMEHAQNPDDAKKKVADIMDKKPPVRVRASLTTKRVSKEDVERVVGKSEFVKTT